MGDIRRSSLILVLAAAVWCQACKGPSTVEVVDQAADKSLYAEKWRPQFHFSPPTQWMNDPNGMFYYEGEYHLFYQHYPDSNVWGPMHWGHAVSTNMVHWENLPIALYPDSLGYIFSGSAVVDWNNTSGFGTNGQPPIVAVFTYHDPAGASNGSNTYQTQGIAYSLDKGRSWIKYEENPVIPNPGINDFRDPKVTWLAEFDKWIMTLAVKDHIEFYASEDLKNWDKLGEFGQDIGAHGGVWECPDLLKMVDQTTGETRWILLVSINPGGPNGGSATQYFTGNFNGRTFIPDDLSTNVRWVDYGADNYAGVTWSDVPAEDGRRLFIGWMSNWNYANVVPTEVWRSAMTLPRQLILDDDILRSVPVMELKELEGTPVKLTGSGRFELPSTLVKVEVAGLSEDFKLSFKSDSDTDEPGAFEIGFEPESSRLFTYRKSGQEFYENFNEIHYSSKYERSPENLLIYIDRSSVEIFLDDGRIVMTEIDFPQDPYRLLDVSGLTSDSEITLTPLSGIWSSNN